MYSTRSRADIDLIIVPYHFTSELAEIDQKMRVTEHYPVHGHRSSLISHSSINEYEVKRIDWVVLPKENQQTVLFRLSSQMDERHCYSSTRTIRFL